MKKKNILVAALALSLSWNSSILAEEFSAHSVFLKAFDLVEKANSSDAALLHIQAQQLKEEAFSLLLKIQKNSPDWERDAIAILMNQCQEEKAQILTQEPQPQEKKWEYSPSFIQEPINNSIAQEKSDYKFLDEIQLSSIVPLENATHFEWAKHYLNTQKYDLAIEQLNIAIAESPSTDQFYYYKGIAFEKMGKSIEANEEYRNALFLNKDFYQAYVKLGLHAFKLHRYEEAIASFAKAAELKPEAAQNYYNLGASYAKLKNFDKAQDFLLQAIKHKAEYPIALQSLAFLYLRQKDKEKCLQTLEKVVALGSQEPLVFNNLGNLYLESGQIKAAMDCFETALNLDKGNALACNNLGMTYSLMGKYEEAIEWGQKAIEISPEFSVAHFNLGSTYYRKKEFIFAEKHLLKTLELIKATSPLYDKTKQLLKEANRLSTQSSEQHNTA